MEGFDGVEVGGVAVALVPVGDGGLAGLPEEADVAAVVGGDEIDVASGEVAQLAADVVELCGEALELLDELLGGGMERAAGGGVHGMAELGADGLVLGVGGGDVCDDAGDQRQGGICMGQREAADVRQRAVKCELGLFGGVTVGHGGYLPLWPGAELAGIASDGWVLTRL